MNDRGPRPRADLAGVPTYKPGRRPAGAGRSFKLSSNESPFPPLPSVLEVIADAAHQTNRYPDLTASALTEALAEKLRLSVDNVVVGCGSVGVATQIVESFAGPGDEVAYGWRSFEAYPIIVQVAGATSVQVPLTTAAAYDLDALAAAITSRTKVIFVCNPNNPTGTAVHRTELEAFLDRVPPECLVVIDEAYCEYIRDADVPDGLTLYRDRPNVAVLRTFSKAYGLAGLRVGYAIAHAGVAEAFRMTNVPFSVSGIAQAAAIASLHPVAEKELLERVDDTVAERIRVVAGLRAAGWRVPDTEANFVWLPTGAGTPAFAAACEEAGIVVRPFGDEGTRITIGEPEANDIALDVARRSAPGPAAHA